MKNIMRKYLSIVLLLCGLFLLVGCDKKATLYSNLEERQANSVMAALLEVGISAEKVAGAENTWDVIIPERHFAVAANILEQQGLPHHVYQGVADVFKKTGMVSSPSEERIRFMEALSQDLSQTISSIEGVIDARVHVVLPENDPFAKNTVPSSAAVAIRHRYDVSMEDQIPQIKSLIKNSIEGLSYEKISVILFADSPDTNDGKPIVPQKDPLFGAQVLQSLATANAALLVLLIAGIVIVWRKYNSFKKDAKEE